MWSNGQNIFCRILRCHSEVDLSSFWYKMWFYHIRHLWKYVITHLPYELVSNGQKCVSWGHSELDLWPQKSNQAHPCVQIVCPVWRNPLKVFLRYTIHKNGTVGCLCASISTCLFLLFFWSRETDCGLKWSRKMDLPQLVIVNRSSCRCCWKKEKRRKLDQSHKRQAVDAVKTSSNVTQWCYFADV